MRHDGKKILSIFRIEIEKFIFFVNRKFARARNRPESTDGLKTPADRFHHGRKTIAEIESTRKPSVDLRRFTVNSAEERPGRRSENDNKETLDLPDKSLNISARLNVKPFYWFRLREFTEVTDPEHYGRRKSSAPRSIALDVCNGIRNTYECL